VFIHCNNWHIVAVSVSDWHASCVLRSVDGTGNRLYNSMHCKEAVREG